MSYRFLTACAAGAALYLSSFSAIHAATINIVRSDAQQFESVGGIRDNTATDGHDIDGAVITAYYADGTSEQITWVGDPSTWTNPDGSTYGSTEGSASGDNINLFMSWDGFEIRAQAQWLAVMACAGSGLPPIPSMPRGVQFTSPSARCAAAVASE